MSKHLRNLLITVLLGHTAAAAADEALCTREAARFAAAVTAAQPATDAATRQRLEAEAGLLCLRSLGARHAATPAAPAAQPAPSQAAEPEPAGPSWSERMLETTEEKDGHKRLRRK